MIHSGSRSDLMDRDRTLRQREERYLDTMRNSGLQKYREVFDQISQRIGLDVFGIDFALVDNEIVIFEANACMNALNQDYGDDRRYQYLEPYVKTLKRAVKKMLVRA